jgi:MYXO-CTERM domain-containing protein
MRARGIALAVLLWASTASAEDALDLDVDECALPDSGCRPESADATLDADEAAGAMPDDPIEWASDPGAVVCAEQATNQGGICVPDANAGTAADTGCSAAVTPGAVVGLAVLLLLVVGRRRRRTILALALAAACTSDASSWDDAAGGGPDGDPSRIDVYGAALGDGDAAQYLMSAQALVTGAKQPTAQFGLAHDAGGVPVVRSASACGDRLSNDISEGAELLGWARGNAGEGTAELVELAAPEGCAVAYETAPEAIAELVAAGYTITGSLGYVWPPGLGDPIVPEVTKIEAVPACKVTKSSPWFLLYASPGADESEQFLGGCPGEVIIGEKHAGEPIGRMKRPENHARGGRTAFVADRNGDMLRELLGRTNGVERTAAKFRKMLANGYDYIVIDEITAAADWADGGSLNQRFRKLLLRVPPRTVIGYVSIDLTQYAGGATRMRARKLLLRALKQRGRGIAMEVYLHTPQVMAGAAGSTYRIAADRLALAVSGLAHGGGINLRAISVIGTSMHSSYPQYRYLDQGKHDLESITKQVNAIRHGSKRLRQQHGVGYYFVNQSDMAPPSAYSYAHLITRLRGQLKKFR